MRVLHVVPSLSRYYGGPVQALVGYVRAATAAGIQVDVIAPRFRGDGGVRENTNEDMLNHLGCAPRWFAGVGRGAGVASPGLWAWLARSAREYAVVHVHGLFNPVSTLAARIAQRAGTPVIIRPFGTLSRYTFEHRRGTAKRAYYRALEAPNLRRAAALHFTSAQERDEARRLPEPASRPAYVIPPPLASAGHRHVVPSGTSSRDAATVAFVGRLHPVKGLEHLIAAWPTVVARVPAATLVIAGDGAPSYVTALRARVAECKIEDRVQFRGFLGAAEVDALLARASAVVLPSLHENFGVAALEGLQAGVPVVVTPEVGLADFISAHGLGLVAPRERAALGAAIGEALVDRQLRERCATIGAQITREHFSTERIGDALRQMYDDTASRRAW